MLDIIYLSWHLWICKVYLIKLGLMAIHRLWDVVGDDVEVDDVVLGLLSNLIKFILNFHSFRFRLHKQVLTQLIGSHLLLRPYRPLKRFLPSLAIVLLIIWWIIIIINLIFIRRRSKIKWSIIIMQCLVPPLLLSTILIKRLITQISLVPS